MTSFFHTLGLMGGRTGTALCRSLAPVNVALQHTDSLARRIGLLGRVGRAGRWLSGGWTRLLPRTVVRVSKCPSW